MAEYPTQEFLHDPENGVVGDCWRACIAGLTGVRLADVPHFARDHVDDWWERSVEFVDTSIPGRGVRLECHEPRWPLYVDGAPRVIIAAGPSPRGEVMHAVLVDAAEGGLVWDPHPSRDGLAGPIVEVYALNELASGGAA